MDLFSSFILGLVQGITEFIPVSSSGHLVIFSKIFHIEESGVLFDAFLHLGTLLAVLIFFWKKWWEVLRGIGLGVAGIFNRSHWQHGKTGRRLFWFLLVGTIPAAIAGLALEDYFDGLFQNLLVVGVSFLIVGVVLVVVERLGRRQDNKVNTRSFKELGWKDIVAAGLAQATALVPGISRSGVTIAAGMGAGLKRAASAQLSFMLSAPVILGAGLVALSQLVGDETVAVSWSALLVGFVTAAVSGLLAIKLLLRFLEKRSLIIFAIYLFIVGALLLIFFS